jgi:hypothetical protein
MFEKLFSKVRPNGKCLSLYSFDFDRDCTQGLYTFLFNYIQNSVGVEIKYGGFYDETYQDSYGKIEGIKAKMIKKKWDDLVNFSLDDDSVQSKSRMIGVEFELTRPIQITIVISNELSFEYSDLLVKLHEIFRINYGFVYEVSIDEWSTAYAHGDWVHSTKLNGHKISESILRRWLNNCERIKDGLIRDIYDVNILTRSHLNKLINGESLEHLINDNKIGSLQMISQDLYLWLLNDRQLKQVRELPGIADIII